MALQINYTDTMGVAHSEAYAKIVASKVDYDNSTGSLIVQIYHNSTTRSKSDEAAKKLPMDEIRYELNDDLFGSFADSTIKADGVSLLSSLYSWLKTHNDPESSFTEKGEHIQNAGHGINWTTATDV